MHLLHLGNNEKLFPIMALNRFPDEFFSVTIGVNLGSINLSDSKIYRDTNSLNISLVVILQIAFFMSSHSPCSQAKFSYLKTILQFFRRNYHRYIIAQLIAAERKTQTDNSFPYPVAVIWSSLYCKLPPTFLPGLKMFSGSKIFFVSTNNSSIFAPYISSRYGVRIKPSLCSAVIEP